MSRAEQAAAAAALAASEAGRTLQAAGQAKAAEAVEPAPERQAPKLDDTRERMMEGVYEGRKKKAAEGAKDEAGFPPPGLPPVDDVGTVTDDQRAEEARAKKAEKAREEATLKARKAEADAAAPDAAAQQEPAATEAPVEIVPTTSKQKVDGVEYDVPLSEIEDAGGDKVWRINKAAENRLAKAKEATEEARKAQAAIAAWQQQQVAQRPPPPSQDQLFAKLAANRFGTDEEFAANLRDVLNVAIPKVDQNTVILQATASIKRDQANAKFAKDFSDITSNPLLKKLANQMEFDGMAPYVTNNNINWGALSQLDWDGFYSTIGNQVRSVVGPRLSQPSATPAGAAASASGTPSQLSEKEARKASIVNPPQAAAARAAAPVEEKPETREEALNRMRKARGIPTG